MINLAATGTLQGQAGTASAVTYTITGMELLGGVETYKVLAQGQLGNTVSALYTVPASTQAFIKEVFLSNTTGSDVLGVIIYINGAASGNQIVSATIPAHGAATLDDDGLRIYGSDGLSPSPLPTNAAKELGGNLDRRFGGTASTSSGIAISSGDNVIYTPAIGLKPRLHWIGLSSSVGNSTEVLAKVKIGASLVPYTWFLGAPGAFSHWESITATTANDEIVLNLSASVSPGVAWALTVEDTI